MPFHHAVNTSSIYLTLSRCNRLPCVFFCILLMQISTVPEKRVNLVLNSEVTERAFKAYQSISFISPA